MEARPEPARPPGWLPKAEFDSIFSRLPDGLYAERRDFLTRHVGLGP